MNMMNGNQFMGQNNIGGGTNDIGMNNNMGYGGMNGMGMNINMYNGGGGRWQFGAEDSVCDKEYWMWRESIHYNFDPHLLHT